MNRPFLPKREYEAEKTRRRAAKRKKLDDLMNLASDDKLQTTSDTLEESYKALKAELQKFQKVPKCPYLSLTSIGYKARVDLSNYVSNSRIETSPLCIEDIYHLLKRSLLGNIPPGDLRWAELENPEKVTKTVLLVLDGLTKSYVADHVSSLSDVIKSFPISVEFASSDLPMANQIGSLFLDNFRNKSTQSSFPVDKKNEVVSEEKIPVEMKDVSIAEEKKDMTIAEEKKDESVAEEKKDVSVAEEKIPNEKEGEMSVAEKNGVSRMHLLLSPLQLALENCPLPRSIFEFSPPAVDKYVFTKRSYLPVTEKSPMYALDCEMVETVKTYNMVARVAIVDEDCQVFYHTFVKPDSKVKAYRTQYSGITPEILVGVNTTLEDVHEYIQNNLPPDAILVGQSLGCDLHALKMIHPYVIDTGLIFNESGTRKWKISLKKLIAKHFDEKIQEGNDGHSPVEDSIACMKLVLLKLKKSLSYGDAVLTNSMQCVEKVSSDSTSLTDGDEGLFCKIAKASKKVCIVGNQDSINSYPGEMLPEKVVKVAKPSVKKIVKATSKNIKGSDFLISHLHVDAVNSDLSKLNLKVMELFSSCPSNTLFMILAPGIENYAGINRGLCMTALKK